MDLDSVTTSAVLSQLEIMKELLVEVDSILPHAPD
jgi:hypothetical protein